MMELSLIRTLHDKEFYEDHKGIKCPDKLFTKDVQLVRAFDTLVIFIELLIV